MNLRAHVINCSNECLRLLSERRRKNEISYLQVEVVRSVDEQILWLQVSVSKIRIMDCLKSFNQLLKVVPGNWLFKSSSLTEDNEQISLIWRKDEISAWVSFEINSSSIIAWDYVFMPDRIKDLSLISCFINFSLLLLVKFDKHLDWSITRYPIACYRVYELRIHQPSKALKIAAFCSCFKMRNARNIR